MSRHRMDALIHLPLLVVLFGCVFCLLLSAPVDSAAPPPSTPTGQAAAPPSADSGTAKGNIVAVVNGQSITRQELAQQCLKRYGETVLESLMNKHLILQACQQRGVQITQKDIEAEIERISARFSLPKDRWLEMLEQERNISPEQYRRDIIWPTLALRSLAANKLVITNEMLAKEFESEYGPKVQVRMIAVSTRDKAEKAPRPGQGRSAAVRKPGQTAFRGSQQCSCARIDSTDPAACWRSRCRKGCLLPEAGGNLPGSGGGEPIPDLDV